MIDSKKQTLLTPITAQRGALSATRLINCAMACGVVLAIAGICALSLAKP